MCPSCPTFVEGLNYFLAVNDPNPIVLLCEGPMSVTLTVGLLKMNARRRCAKLTQPTIRIAITWIIHLHVTCMPNVDTQLNRYRSVYSDSSQHCVRFRNCRWRFS